MPRPPPPAEALISTGKPNWWASDTAWASLSINPSLPGTVGTLTCLASFRAAFLSPTKAIAFSLDEVREIAKKNEKQIETAAKTGKTGKEVLAFAETKGIILRGESKKYGSDGWFRMDLRKGWIERAEVLFLKPKA